MYPVSVTNQLMCALYHRNTVNVDFSFMLMGTSTAEVSLQLLLCRALYYLKIYGGIEFLSKIAKSTDTMKIPSNY